MNRCVNTLLRVNTLLSALLGLIGMTLARPAPAIEMYQAHEIQPYHAHELEAPQKKAGSCASLIGTWQTNVPGAVYIIPGSSRYYDVLHVSAGGPKGLLRIHANGRYTWNTYGGKRGRWLRSNDPAYPVVLVDNAEHKKWKVGCDPKHTGGRDIVIWDDYVNYDGRR